MGLALRSDQRSMLIQVPPEEHHEEQEGRKAGCEPYWCWRTAQDGLVCEHTTGFRGQQQGAIPKAKLERLKFSL